MKLEQSATLTAVFAVFDRLFLAVFLIISFLNALLVHPVPGLLYLGFSLLYLPSISTAVHKKFSVAIHPLIKIILGFVVLWGTLAVSDLAELLGL